MPSNASNTDVPPPSVLFALHAAADDASFSVSPETLMARAVAVLEERLGPSDDAPQSAFVPGATGLLSDHTHYSNGFALLMPLTQGTALAWRPSSGDATRFVFDGEPTTWTLPAPGNAPDWARVASRVLQRRAGGPVDVAIVSTIPTPCRDAYWAALSVGLAQGPSGLTARADRPESTFATLREIVEDTTGVPYSVAYPIAAYAGHNNAFLLVDTATLEHLPVETAARDDLRWHLLLGLGAPPALDKGRHRARRDQADEALAYLREHGFSELQSFRELEHRQLPHAIDALPPRLHPTVRYLVTENRRVQKMVAALRRQDWQMVGALLLMSHTSRRDDGGGTPEAVDALVDRVEHMRLEGVYGAAMTGRGGEMVVVGRPSAGPLLPERLVAEMEQQVGRVPRALPL